MILDVKNFLSEIFRKLTVDLTVKLRIKTNLNDVSLQKISLNISFSVYGGLQA